MAKYALNTRTGEVTICKRTVGRCDHELDQHYDNESDARKAFESMSSHKEKLSIFSRGKREFQVSLDSIMDIERIPNLMKEKYLRSPQHPDDDTLRILCYGPRAQMEGVWNNVTRQSRGLIVRSSRSDFKDAIVVQRPWEKFYTLSQMESGWHLGDDEEGTETVNDSMLGSVDFNARAEVTDKLDGSMLVLYRDPKGNPAVATKGSFDMPREFNKFIRENDNFNNTMNELLDDHSDKTFIFEGVSPTNRIVLKYDKTDVRLIGITKKKSGLYVPLNDYDHIWSKEKGLNRTSPMPASTLNEALSLKPRDNAEGLIVRIITDDASTQKQIKIKQEDYLKMHKARTNFSPKDIRIAIRGTSATADDVLKAADGDISWMKAKNDLVNGLDEKDDADEIKRRHQMLKNAMTENLVHYKEGYKLSRKYSDVKEKRDLVARMNEDNVHKDVRSSVFFFFGKTDDDLKTLNADRFMDAVSRKVKLDIMDV